MMKKEKTKIQEPKQAPVKKAESVKELRASHHRMIDPGMQILPSARLTVIGLLLRLFPALCLVIGLYLFWDNAFGLGSATAMPLSVIAFAVIVFFTSLFYAMRYHKITAVVGGILSVLIFCAYIGLGCSALKLDPFTLLVSAARGFFNTAISHMMTVGYGVLYVFKLSTPYTEGAEAIMALYFFVLLQMIISAIIGWCTARRIRVLPIAVITAIAYTVVFLYNISTSKWGFALSFVGVAGLLTMWMGDKYAVLPQDQVISAKDADTITSSTIESNNSRLRATQGGRTISNAEVSTPLGNPHSLARSSAVVGWGAGLCSLLALLCAAVPAVRVKNIWKTYDKIDTVMETIRAYEMALITGEDMQITDLGLTGAAEILEARSSIATPRSFTGKTVLEVRSNLTLPVYLRSWISTTVKDDLWYVADEETREEFNETFGTDFRAEDITYRFLRNLNPRLVKYNSKTSYANHEDDGYMTTLISLKNIGVAGNILFLPSRLDSEVSLLDYGTLDVPYRKKWINYFDGIAYSRAFHKGAEYSAVANIPLYKEEDWMQSLNKKLYTYAEFAETFLYVGDDITSLFDNGKLATVVGSMFEMFSLDKLEEYYLSLDADGRLQFAEEMEEANAYNNYVKGTDIYISLTEDEQLNEKLRQLAQEIVYAEPLPDTGLVYNDTQPAMLLSDKQFLVAEDGDLTDMIGMEAAMVTVGDLVSAIYATDKGNLYLSYGDPDTVITYPVVPEDETIRYVHMIDGDNSVSSAIPVTAEEDPLIDELDKEFEDVKNSAFFDEPLVTVREIRGTDDSLIDIEYHVNHPEAFHAFLERYYPDYVEYYYTAYAQRIAEYLANNMTYTLNPTLPEDVSELDTVSSVERFLFDTKDGYCVQYATSATLLLRTLGVPTRYVEGYIADSFVKNEDKSQEKIGNYICNVKDSNAHAWCEIYLENYGWLTTEVTTPYYSDLYDPYEQTSYNYNRDNTGGSYESPTVDDTEIEEEEDTFWEIWGTLITTLAVTAAVLAVLIYISVRFFQSRNAMRYKHEVTLADAKRFLISEDARAQSARYLYDEMRRLMRAMGLKPLTGETPAEYCHRADIRFKMRGLDGYNENGASVVLPIIEKNEFSDTTITAEELAAFAEYLVRLDDIVRSEAGFFKTVWLQYFMGLL